MRFLGRSLIETKIIPACRLKTFMAEDGFDVTNRATIEKQLRRGGVPKDMWGHLLTNPRQLSMALEVAPEIITLEAVLSVLTDKQCRTIVLPRFHVSPDPSERTVGEKDCTLLVALADDPGFAPLEVDAVAILHTWPASSMPRSIPGCAAAS
jgi:hypothetical protein